MKKLICAICALCCISIHAQQTINLAGAWQFSMGETPQYDDYVMLPGSMLTNGKGNDITMTTPWTGSLYDSSYYFNPYMEKYRVEGNVKLPFFLTPDKHYIGAAWYRRTVYVPRTWTKQRIMLHLERAHIETTVYINGKQAGHAMSLSVPHRYDVTDYIKAGEKNEIAIRVYNGIENVCVGQDSHSVTDQTQGNWNGIVGRIELQARPRELNIRSVRVYPEISNRRARVVVNMENRVDGLRFMPQRDYWVNVEVEALGKKMPNKRFVGDMKEALGNTLTFYVEFGEDMQLWDEFSPALYQLTAYAGDDIYTCQFGMREISIKGRQLYLNGRPIWIRGTVENCCFPETGYPPTDEASWLRVFRKCREYGINMVRFHSYCPPEAAFSAADKVGIYLQPEGPSWPNHGVRLRRGMAIDQYLMDECKALPTSMATIPRS
jgi:beta-galactosidase/beta-glucuronidase